MKRFVLIPIMLYWPLQAQYALSGSGSTTAAAEINGKPNWQTANGTACAGLNGTVGKDFCTDISTSPPGLYEVSVTGTPATWVKVAGSGTVTSVQMAGTPNQLTATGTCTITSSGVCTFSIPSGFVLPGTIDGLTITTTTGTLTISGAKVLTVSNSLTLAGTDNVTLTFPSTNATIARTDAGQTFTGTQTFSTPIATGSGGTGEAGTFTGVRKANSAGADTAAVSGDVVGLFSGGAGCTGTNLLASNGTCQSASGSGTVTSSGGPVSPNIAKFSTATNIVPAVLDTDVAAAPGQTIVTPAAGVATYGSLAGVNVVLVGQSGTPPVLTANVTSSVCPIGATGDKPIMVVMRQDGTGGRTNTWPSCFNNPPTIASEANAVTVTQFTLNTQGTYDENWSVNTSGHSVTILGSAPTAPPASGVLYCWPDSTRLTMACENSSSVITTMPNVASGGTLQTTGAFTINLTCAANCTPTIPSGATTLLYSGGPGGTPSAINLGNATALPTTAIAVPQGNGAKVQLSTGSPVSGNCTKFDANGNTIDAGAPCGSGGGSGGGIPNPACTFVATNTGCTSPNAYIDVSALNVPTANSTSIILECFTLVTGTYTSLTATSTITTGSGIVQHVIPLFGTAAAGGQCAANLTSGAGAAGSAGVVQGSNGSGGLQTTSATDNGTTFAVSEPVDNHTATSAALIPAFAGGATSGAAKIAYDVTNKVTNVATSDSTSQINATLVSGHFTESQACMTSSVTSIPYSSTVTIPANSITQLGDELEVDFAALITTSGAVPATLFDLLIDGSVAWKGVQGPLAATSPNNGTYSINHFTIFPTTVAAGANSTIVTVFDGTQDPQQAGGGNVGTRASNGQAPLTSFNLSGATHTIGLQLECASNTGSASWELLYIKVMRK